MFQLFRSRDKSVRILLGAVLLFVAFTLVYTLAPTGGMGMGPGAELTLAEIGDEKLSEMEVRQALQRQLQQRQMPAQMAEFYVPVMVNQMVQDRALAFEARRLGFEVSEQELVTTLQSLLPQLYEGGKFAGREMYARMVESQGMSIPEFESNVRKQMMVQRLEALALEGVVVTPAEVEAEYRRKNEKLKIAYFAISADKLRSRLAATPEEIQQAFEKNRAAHQIPEKRNYLLFVVDEEKVASTVSVPEPELRRAYETRKESFRTPERVRVRHILLKTTDKSPEEVAKIEKRMQDLLKQARGGANFADLASKNSEDPGSAAKGGDVDWVTRGQMVPEFEQASFTVKPGQISDVVKTMYGFHILKVEAKEDARLRPFEEVRADLEKELGANQIANKTQELANQVRSTLIKSAPEAEKFAQANNITVLHANGLAPSDPVPQVGASEEFRESAGRLPKNGVSSVIPVGASKLVVAQVTDVLPARPAELKEVEMQIRGGVVAEKANRLFNDQVAELNAKLKDPKADLAKLAKEYGAEIKTPAEFSGEGAVEGLGPASTVEAGFNMNVGELFGPVRVSGEQAFVCKVVGKTPADLTRLAAERDLIVQSIKSRKAKERRDLFADGVLKSLINDKKVKINNEAVTRLATSYRTGGA